MRCLISEGSDSGNWNVCRITITAHANWRAFRPPAANLVDCRPAIYFFCIFFVFFTAQGLTAALAAHGFPFFAAQGLREAAGAHGFVCAATGAAVAATRPPIAATEANTCRDFFNELIVFLPLR
jgi:hypothetical protein